MTLALQPIKYVFNFSNLLSLQYALWSIYFSSLTCFHIIISFFVISMVHFYVCVILRRERLLILLDMHYYALVHSRYVNV